MSHDAQVGEAVHRFVKIHAAHCRHQHDRRQGHQHDRQPGENALVAPFGADRDMIQPQRQPQREHGNRHQLEEAAPGILGVGQAAVGDDLLAAEEVGKLHQHEHAKQHIHQPQHNAGLDDAQPEQRACLAFGWCFINLQGLQRDRHFIAISEVGFRVILILFICRCGILGLRAGTACQPIRPTRPW